MKTKITKRLFLGFTLFLMGAFGVSATPSLQVSSLEGASKENARGTAKQSKVNTKQDEITLKQAGPINIGGRVRALLCDKRDATGKTLYAGGVAGGLYRSVNGGNSWELLPGDVSHATVSCIVQDDEGTIYVGTGEGFMNTTNSMVTKNNGTFVGSGKLGMGVFKTSSASEAVNFVPLSTTVPDEDNILNPAFDWAYVNELAYNSDTKYLYAATNTGILYSSNKGQNWTKYSVNGISQDIKMVGNLIYFTQKTSETKGFVVKRTANSDLSQAVEVFSKDDTCIRGEKFTTPFGRIELAVTPLDDQFIYASIAYSDGSLAGVFLSEKQGSKEGNQTTWRKLTSSSFYLFEDGNYSNTIIVDPSDKRSIICGGYLLQRGTDVNLDGGYYYWDRLSTPSTPLNPYNAASLVPADIYKEPTYLHENIHVITPFPTGTMDSFYVANDGGIAFYGKMINGESKGFQLRNKGLNITQFFSVAVANDGSLMAGSQGNANLYISRPSENSTADVVVYPSATLSSYPLYNGIISGGNVQASMFQRVVPSVRKAFFTTEPFTVLARMYGDYYNFNNSQAWNFGGGSYYPSRFSSSSKEVVSSVLWETTTDSSIKDSVICRISAGMIVYEKYGGGDTIGYTLKRGDTIKAGYKVFVRSGSHFDYPFMYTFPNDFYLTINGQPDGFPIDTTSFNVKNPIQNRLFVEFYDNIYMTNRPTDFTMTSDLSEQSQMLGWDNGIISSSYYNPSAERIHCIAITNDGNTLFYTVDEFATQKSKLYRVSNLLNYMENNPEILDIKHIFTSSRPISSISLDQQNQNNMLLTCENISNEEANVLYSQKALSSDIEEVQASFKPKTGDLLRKMPVYASLIEMHDSNRVFIGTDDGMYQTTNFLDANPTWVSVDGLTAPVYMIIQQTKNIAAANLGYTNTGGVTEQYSWAGTSLSGAIYIATHGKGIYYCDDEQFINAPKPAIGMKLPKEASIQNSLKIYPNPATDQVNIEYELTKQNKVFVKVVGLDGKLLYQKDLGIKAKGKYIHNINCSNMPKGVSVVQIITGNEVMTSKMILR